MSKDVRRHEHDHFHTSLTEAEYTLARWMLEHGQAGARSYLAQLQEAEATTWKCPCGCASYNLRVRGMPEAPTGVGILGDFMFGDEDNLAGIFIFQSGGILSGVEVYGMASEAPDTLPSPVSLRKYSESLTAEDRARHRDDA